jgi:hypothetical protein
VRPSAPSQEQASLLPPGEGKRNARKLFLQKDSRPIERVLSCCVSQRPASRRMLRSKEYRRRAAAKAAAARRGGRGFGPG